MAEACEGKGAKRVRRKAEDEKQKYNPSAANGVTQGLACQGGEKNTLSSARIN